MIILNLKRHISFGERNRKEL